MKCTCDKIGFCPYHKVYMTERFLSYKNGTSGLPKEREEAYIRLLYNQPSTFDKAISMVKATAKHFLSGGIKVSEEVYNRRLNICCQCIHCDKTDEIWECKACGCKLQESKLWPGKARWASQECPVCVKCGQSKDNHKQDICGEFVPKWPRIELPQVKTKNPPSQGGCGCH